MVRSLSRPFLVALATLVLAMSTAAPASVEAQAAPAPAVAPASPAPVPPPPPGARLVSSIRNKLSAADLLSAESLAEVHRETQGDDGFYLLGVSWLARGALLLGEEERARHHVAEVRRRCDARMARGVRPEADDSLEIALGAAIEVEAQLRADSKGRKDALRFLDAELARIAAPVALRSRIQKRRNLLALEGQMAPELKVEDHTGSVPPTLESLRGKPVLVYVWDKGCGDCRAQSATLSKVAARYKAQGLEVVPLTRYYAKDDLPREKARLDSTWAADYQPIGPRPLAISAASMVDYGGSSTPTFAFVDARGVVRSYLPYRLTEAQFEAEIAKILR
jgi:thiol-disulfide isomerase/thioredoxin